MEPNLLQYWQVISIEYISFTCILFHKKTAYFVSESFNIETFS